MMSESLIVAVIAAVPLIITSTASLITAVKTRKAVQELHLAVNSRLTELLEQTAKASHADGVVEGKEGKIQ
jgi:hypothetical protein